MEAIIAEEPQTVSPPEAGIPAPARRHQSTWAIAWNVLLQRPTGMIGFIILLFFAVLATIGPMLYPEHLATDPFNSFAAPSWHHLLGTDFDGTDTLALIITGSRYVLLSAFLAGMFTVLLGSVTGLISGYYLGVTDSALMKVADFVLTIPAFPLLVVLSTIWRFGDPLSMGLVLGAIGWGALARAIRAQVLSLRERTFIEAAHGLGFSSYHIILKEILPNLGSYIAMKFLLAVTGAMYASVGLFFLGVLPFKVNNWGVMLNFAFTQSGAMYSSSALAYLLSPLCAILLVTLGVVLFLDAVDEIFNPRLRKS